MSDPFPESNLLSSDDQQTLNQWINNPGQQWRRCYAITVDGASSQTFHNQCNYRGPSVVVIQYDSGNIAGGYTETGWSSLNTYETATQAFLFSVTHGKRYPLTEPSRATYNFAKLWPDIWCRP